MYVSDDSREMPAYSELMHDASHAIAQVQKALNSRSVILLLLTAIFRCSDGLITLRFDALQPEGHISESHERIFAIVSCLLH